MDISYVEGLDKLQIRIRAHKEFANFDVSTWIDEFCRRAPRHAILDVGCGSGNHLGVYAGHVGKSGRVIGFEREPGLVNAARETYSHVPQVEITQGTMDERFPFPDDSFDLVTSNFAIYYASDPAATLNEIRRVLTPGGQVLLIGPTRNNAREIYEFNKRLTGVEIEEITLRLTDRIRQEVLPIVRDLFGNPEEIVLNSFLEFPSVEEFLLYFQSTMVYEETAKKRGFTREEMRALFPATAKPTVSKEMLALVATK